MAKPTDVRPIAAAVYFLPIKTRMPLKFGPEIITEVTCARIRVTVADTRGRRAEGWGETPLSVQWVWPSRLGYEERHQVLRKLTARIAESWVKTPARPGHPIELGDRFLEGLLPDLLDQFNDAERRGPSLFPGSEHSCAHRRLTWPCTTPTACFTRCRPTRPITHAS